MSDYLRNCVVSSKLQKDSACASMLCCIEAMVRHYSFRLAQSSPVLRVKKKPRTQLLEACVIPERFQPASNPSDLDVCELQREFDSFIITGSFRIPSSRRLLNVELGIIPSGDEDEPYVTVCHLDHWMYSAMWSENDEIIEFAARELRDLVIRLGANSHHKGFFTIALDSCIEAPILGTTELLDSLLNPSGINSNVLSEVRRPIHATASGIDSSLTSLAAVGKVWGKDNVCLSSARMIIMCPLLAF